MVAGSGAAGMTAALTAAHLGLSVLVIEKAGHFGGSTARSGGGIWAPGNTVLREPGSRTRRSRPGPTWRTWRRASRPHGGRRCSSTGRPCSDLVLAMTPVRFAWVPGYADYYPEAQGGLAAGRSIEPVPLDGRKVLGAELDHLARPYLPSPVAITQAEYRWLSLGRHPRGIRAGLRVAGRTVRARLLGQRMLSLGQALAAGLRAGLEQAGVPVWLDTPLAGLETEDGRVTGVRVSGRGAGADPGPARGADRHRRLRARRADAPPLPARAGGDRVDDRRGREHRRRDPGGPGPRRGHRADGRCLVGAVDPAARRPVLLPGRTQPAGLRPGQRRGPALRQRVGAVRRRGARHVRRQHAGEPAHPGLAGLRPALPGPVRVRGPAAGQGPAAPLVRRRGGAPRGRPGRAGPRRPGSTPTAWSRP